MLPAMLLAELIGDSQGIGAVREQVARLVGPGAEAVRLPPVLLQGETGTGKGLVARALHLAGPRRNGPFVDVNCAAIPEALFEAEMFGVERGAFTGADRARPGLFQTAHRGTLFLDEIGLIPHALQSKLLKALEERKVRRLGRATSEPVDTWILAATSEDLDEAMRTGRFRRDLYHRLAVMTLRLPPLRDRGADVVLLAEHFLQRVCADYGYPRKSLADDARTMLGAYAWPGNVRELANVMERAALLSDHLVLTADALGLAGGPDGIASVRAGSRHGLALREMLETAERERLLEALRETGGNLSHAAARLRIPRNTLRYRMERLGLRPPPPSRRAAGAPEAPPGRSDAVQVVPPTPSPRAGDSRRLSWLRAELVGEAQIASDFDTSRALGMIADKIRGFGGEIEMLHLSRVTAVFGLEPVEDAPRRAALAALAVQKAAERARRSGAWPWSVGLAIHVHDCVLDAGERGTAVEGESGRAATLVLETLASAASRDSVVISEAAARHLERRFELVPVLSEACAGPAYRLTGQERPGFGLPDRVSGFVGRQQELALLQSRLASVVAGRGHVVAIIGEPGIGKTRLLFEFQQRFGTSEVTCLEGRCASYASAIPYFPVVDLVRRHGRITEADGPEAIEQRIELALARVGMAAGEDGLYLLQLLGATREAGQLRGVTPQLMKERTFEALRQMVLRESRLRPVALVMEDLHWIDTTSDELLAQLVDTVPAARILLVATYRPGYQPSWLARSYVSQMALAPLSSEDSRVVLSSALARAPVASVVADAIVAKAEGNPFFLEELARAVGEHAERDGSGVPDTIQSVLMARISRLAEEDRRLLQAAAVIGRDVPVAVLEALAEDGEAMLRARLTRLQAAEFLYETRATPTLEYTFKHALTHDVAYQTLPQDQRRTLHARAARALLNLPPATAERRPEIVARHLTAAELPAEAIPHWLSAGRNAIRRSANAEAISHLRTGLDLLMRMPETRERDRQELQLQVTLGPVLIMTKTYAAAEVDHVYTRARALSQGLGETASLVSASVGVFGAFTFHLVRGDLRAAQGTAERLLTIAVEATSAGLLVEAHFALGASLHYRGRFRDASAHLEKSIALYDPRRDAEHAFEYGQDPLVASLCHLAYGRSLQGHEADSLRYLEAALRRAGELGHAFTHACALHFASLIHELRGEFGTAGEYAEREIAIAREHRFPFWLAGGMHLRGRALAAQGHRDEGLRLMNEELASCRATGAHLAVPYLLCHIADAHLSAGNVPQGLAAVVEGLAVAEGNDQQTYLPELLRLRGELLACDPATSREAEVFFEHAVSLARQQRSRVLARRAAASLAEYLRARGRAGEAEQMLADLHRALATDAGA